MSIFHKLLRHHNDPLAEQTLFHKFTARKHNKGNLAADYILYNVLAQPYVVIVTWVPPFI